MSNLSRQESRIVKGAYKLLDMNEKLRDKCNSVLNSIALEQQRLGADSSVDPIPETSENEDKKAITAGFPGVSAEGQSKKF